ncbi:NAD(P)-binding domain-containing protein [Cocleimonas sp. KMM 6892]|uniref:NAD(P)-binding domain-containing protein n=1 Tax=unclassified Cocleimonas TaxID=2639732 RepID=UPI002DBDD335|nr:MULTISPECIES: NAD(P)-binding domain-containing protein [unclassified Cocleimonas]MEB8434007.1 NAD(P)-binding domain-containing protein [Cocleimonas sp. KMM 6892]MEC4716818.1 NAD(P)-binding domain-containing protein [Cocleimonas sp. KMM 6895]MEC4746027.1 NAD(P)-binding domain-containing protein [Cocleimonas sp. KMM 6896]
MKSANQQTDQQANRLRLGILGTGHLATYTVTGLRRSGDTRQVIVSPRNAERAKYLADNQQCIVAEDNQGVIDQSDLILLAVRPWQLTELLEGLVFPKDKIVVSAVAGLTLDQVRNKADLPDKLALILPVVAAENAQGFVPIYPDIPEVKALADSLGKTIAFKQESQFEEASAMACLNGWLYRFFDEQYHWLIKNGIEEEDARNMVLHNTLGAAHYALGRPQQDLSELAGEIAREGTYTKAGLDQLEAGGAFKQWSDTLDMIKAKLDASDE